MHDIKRLSGEIRAWSKKARLFSEAGGHILWVTARTDAESCLSLDKMYFFSEAGGHPLWVTARADAESRLSLDKM